ncbi:AraC family transcriptional regulator [Novosphingobium kaempferiae]|uniref:AraC family transcriptional regulator n=1 Tax=Novosphingobium kaempferiae TaxID=2896849 RepID=UPI001E385A3A|nr:AraC family transcriptional regulator [Novosphingobium kaempferiae]
MIIQNPPSDPLSDLLAVVQARPACSVRLEAGGEWSLRFRPQSCKFNVVRHGHCWLVAGDERRRLSPGDCVVIKERAEFTLASDPSLDPVDARVAFADNTLQGRYGSGNEVEILGGSVTFDATDASPVLDLLPPTLVVSADATAAAPIAWLLDQLDREWREGLAGSRTACDDLLRLMFIHALRAHFAQAGDHAPGWIAALADPPLAAAIRAIHAEPARQWRLEELAGIARQSRSTFAARFKARVGVAPVDYAAGWRLTLAAARLRSGRESASTVAGSLGFLSDSAFGAAFKRKFGVSPGRYRVASAQRDEPVAA